MQDSSAQSEIDIKGSIIGLLVGDALGYPYEDRVSVTSVDMIEGKHGESSGWWTSSSALAIATMSSINDMEEINPEDILNRFNDVYVSGFACPEQECKDISSVTAESIKNYTNGMPPDRCGIQDACDNDCLLRILPVSLYSVCLDIDEIMSNSHLVCSFTHSSIYSQVCCFVYSLIIRNILLNKAEKIFDVAEEFYKNKDMSEHAEGVAKLRSLKYTDKDKPSSNNSKDISVTFWEAWGSYSKHQNDYSVCVTDAIMNSRDRNGTAALSGSFSGLANGVNDIPFKWLKSLKLNTEHMEIIQIFVDRIVSKIR